MKSYYLSRLARMGCAMLIAGAGVSAHALTGEELYNYCRREACGGYFVGAFDAVRLAAAVGDVRRSRGNPLRICPPLTVDDDVAVQLALDYLERHPEQRHLQAANLSLRAWAEVWPCDD